MTALLIRQPGPSTSVQDMGRPGARRWGVPVSGTLAPDWLALANALVGNAANAAGLEFRLSGPRLEVEADALRLAVGGPAEMRVEADGEPRLVPPWHAVIVRRGETVSIGRVTEGTTAVLAVSGGVATPPVLGSRATYARALLGGLEGRALQPGDRLPIGKPSDATPRSLAAPPEEDPGPVRLVLGPQEDHFQPAAIEALLGEAFQVTDQIDRMGMRLSGPLLRHQAPDLAQIVSDGIVPGAIQVPGNGQPIVLLADGQTVGGYPKIATVIRADLPRLARSAPGGEVRFAAVRPAEAEAVFRTATAALTALAEAARPTSLRQGVDLRRLYQSNLVDGVVDTTRPDNFPGHLERPAR